MRSALKALTSAAGAVVDATAGSGGVATSIAKIIGDALGGLSGLCDGLVVGDTLFFAPVNLGRYAQSPFTERIHDPGSGSPVGCGRSNSNYSTDVELQRLDPVATSSTSQITFATPSPTAMPVSSSSNSNPTSSGSPQASATTGSFTNSSTSIASSSTTTPAGSQSTKSSSSIALCTDKADSHILLLVMVIGLG